MRTNFFGRIDGRVEVLQKAAFSSGLIVDQDLESLIRTARCQLHALWMAVSGIPADLVDQDVGGRMAALQEGRYSLDDQGIQRRGLGDLRSWRVLQVLLLPFAGFGVAVSEDEVDLVGRTALVGTEHDCKGGLRGCQRRFSPSDPRRS